MTLNIRVIFSEQGTFTSSIDFQKNVRKAAAAWSQFFDEPNDLVLAGTIFDFTPLTGQFGSQFAPNSSWYTKEITSPDTYAGITIYVTEADLGLSNTYGGGALIGRFNPYQVGKGDFENEKARLNGTKFLPLAGQIFLNTNK